jgi:hypothetical protein
MMKDGRSFLGKYLGYQLHQFVEHRCVISIPYGCARNFEYKLLKPWGSLLRLPAGKGRSQSLRRHRIEVQSQ